MENGAGEEKNSVLHDEDVCVCGVGGIIDAEQWQCVLRCVFQRTWRRGSPPWTWAASSRFWPINARRTPRPWRWSPSDTFGKSYSFNISPRAPCYFHPPQGCPGDGLRFSRSLLLFISIGRLFLSTSCRLCASLFFFASAFAYTWEAEDEFVCRLLWPQLLGRLAACVVGETHERSRNSSCELWLWSLNSQCRKFVKCSLKHGVINLYHWKTGERRMPTRWKGFDLKTASSYRATKHTNWGKKMTPCPKVLCKLRIFHVNFA